MVKFRMVLRASKIVLLLNMYQGHPPHPHGEEFGGDVVDTTAGRQLTAVFFIAGVQLS